MQYVRPFVRLIGISRVAVAGASLVTAAFVGDVLLILGEMFVHLSNPYIGIVAYMTLPALMLLGLLMIPVGIWLRVHRMKHPFSLRFINRLVKRGVVRRPGHIALVIFALTGVNLVAFAALGYRGYHYMDSTEFCGEVCHEVMIPEYTAYERSPHSKVECVACHIGPGAEWFVKAKISGARQVLAVIFNTYEKPIKTPIENLRPARETCAVCHRPELFHGNLIRVFEHFATDRDNTRSSTVLNMRVGGGGEFGRVASGIHWHVAQANELRFYAEDYKRENIVYVEKTRPDGSTRVWTRPDDGFDPSEMPEDSLRSMDCVDCHNRPTHIYLPQVAAIEQRMSLGELDVSLPWIREIAEEVLSVRYETSEQAMEGIERETMRLYRERHPEVYDAERARIHDAIAVLKDIDRQQVFPQMKIYWNTYPSLIGHADKVSKRCFRCHDGEMRDQDGKRITIECDSCHYVLARDSQDPQVMNVLHGQPAFYKGVQD
jgi:hypothetical protein